jgi:membrane dipeptidase
MERKLLIFDAHLDLAMNALEWNRDLRWTTEEIRKSEEGMTDKPDRTNGTVSLPSMAILVFVWQPRLQGM